MSAYFDGSATTLLRTGSLVGVSDSKKGVFSAWVKPDAISGTQTLFAGGAVTSIQVTIGSSGQVNLGGNGISGTAMTIASDNSVITAGAWNHIVASWDTGSSYAEIYVNRTDANAIGSIADVAIAYATNSLRWRVGASNNATAINFFAGKMYDLAFWPGVSVDITDADVLKFFVSSDGRNPAAGQEYHPHKPGGVKPVGYGHDGSISAGAPAAIYFAGDWRTNKGTGGAFTLSGDFTDVSTANPDIPNAYRGSALYTTPGMRWFDSERSGFSFPRSGTFVESREGHPDFGKRMGLSERDEETRDVGPLRSVTVSTLVRGGDEEDEEDTRMI